MPGSFELFARREREGWLCLGNEITGRDIREDLERIRGNRNDSDVSPDGAK